MDLVKKVTELLIPITEERQIEIIDVAYKKEGKTLVLRVLLDKKEGITLDECSRINNELSQILEKESLINERYILEVSSPGLDRQLIKRKDFEWALGKLVKVTTYAPIDGKNVFIGKLLGISESAIVIRDNEETSTEIPLNKIAKAKLEATFNEW